LLPEQIEVQLLVDSTMCTKPRTQDSFQIKDPGKAGE